MHKSTKSIVMLPPDSIKDLTGKRFGKWVVLEYVGEKGCHRLWLCRCKCGLEKNVNQSNLLRKLSTQCQRCAWNSRRIPRTKLFRAWRVMTRHGRLPKVWQDFDTFRKVVGEPPDDIAQLAKYDVTKPHGPGNTFWMTKKSVPQVQQIRQKLKEESILRNKVFMKIRTAKTKDEKQRYMIAARKAGHTYEMIAIAAGLTHQRIQQIIAKSLE